METNVKADGITHRKHEDLAKLISKWKQKLEVMTAEIEALKICAVSLVGEKNYCKVKKIVEMQEKLDIEKQKIRQKERNIEQKKKTVLDKCLI